MKRTTYHIHVDKSRLGIVPYFPFVGEHFILEIYAFDSGGNFVDKWQQDICVGDILEIGKHRDLFDMTKPYDRKIDTISTKVTTVKL